MADSMDKLVKVSALDALAAKISSKIQAVETKSDSGFKSAKVINGNTIALYTNQDGTGTAALTLDFPAEKVLDTTKTRIVPDFHFASGNYTGATNPNYDGQAVLVLAVKTIDKGTESVEYLFLSMGSLMDTYAAADNSINVNGYTIAVKISNVANNALELKSDGLHVNISGKQDKDVDAVVNHIAKFDNNGNAIDAGIAVGNVLTNADIANDSDVAAVLSTYFN